MYIVLIICIILFLIISLRIYGNDVMCPPVIVLLMFLMSSAVGLLRFRDWKLNEYGVTSTFIMLLALFGFLFGSLVGASREKMPKKKCDIRPIRHSRIDLSSFIISIMIVCMALTNILIYRLISTIDAKLSFGHASVSETINNFRIIATYYQDRYDIPSYIKLLNYVCTVFGTISVFFLCHNLAFKVKKPRDICYFVSVLMWITVCLIQSNRGGILFVLSESIYFVYFFWNMFYAWSHKVSWKIIRRGIIVFAGFMVLFIGLASGLGRINSIADLDIVNYITVYISSGIRNFDLFIQNPPETKGFGIETFPSIYRTINYRLGIGKPDVKAWLEFRYIDGLLTSNIYTCFRRYFSDFKYIGIIGLPFLIGWWFTMSYYKIKRSCYLNTITFRMILFAYLSRALFYMPIDDTLFEFEVSVNGVFKAVLLFIVFRLFAGKRIQIDNINEVGGIQ